MEKWLVAASAALTLVLGWTVWDDARPEWQRYQKAYYRLALGFAQNDAQKEWARSQRVEIRQLQLKERGTVERCLTCHLAYDNPLFRDFAEPLRAHSPLIDSHPPERFGCVACHGGEGRAVTTLEAHGQGEVQAKPLLKNEYMQAACYGCHGRDTLPARATASVIRGRQLVNRYFCLGCHKVNGEGSDEGPELSTAGSERSWLWLYAHTTRPQGIVAGSTMPVISLKRDEIRDITVYLMTLQDNRDRVRNLALVAKRVAKEGSLATGAEQPIRMEASAGGAEREIEFTYDGRRLFRGAGCSLCHLVGATGGEVGPALTYIGRKRDSDDLERLLKNPDEVLPGGKMPQLYLNEGQIKALVSYLSARR